MRIPNPLKWHGGKYYLATRVVSRMPPHLHYVEPYFGGGSVLLAKDPEGVSEVINDIDERLTNFWMCLAHEDYFGGLRRVAEASPFCETLFNACLGHLERPCDNKEPICVACAYAFFVACRQSLAGRMNAFTGVTKTRTRRGMNNEVSAWLSAVEGLPAVHGRLKRVLILNRDALDVIKEQDGPDTLFYLDPPYLQETRAAPDVYAHEMTCAGHDRLLSVLAGIRGKFLLSGYHSDLYDDAAAGCGWPCEEFDLPNQAAGGKEKRRMTECLWRNF